MAKVESNRLLHNLSHAFLLVTKDVSGGGWAEPFAWG